MGGNVGEPVSGHGLGAVPVVIVEVDDQYPAAEKGLVGARRDRGIIKEAKPHSARGLGVVPGRPHQGEDRARRHRGLDRGDRTAGGAPCDGQRPGVDENVTR